MNKPKSINSAYIEVTLDGYARKFTSQNDIVNAQVTVGQNEKSSSCTITIADPYSSIAADLIKHSLQAGGIQKLPDTPKDANANANSTAPTSNVAQPGTTDQWVIAIVRECLKQGVTDRGQIAYILGSAEHESAMGKNMLEFDSGAKYEGRLDIGNNQPGDGKRYKGRGLVQITGKGNYKNWSKRLGADFVSNPDLVIQAQYALPILVLGMRDGSFTGAKLSSYISGTKQDFLNARRIVNGYVAAQAQDCKTKAESYLSKMDNLIKQAGGATVNTQQPKPDASTSPAATTTPDTVKGNKLWVDISGYTFEFFHQGTYTKDDGTTDLYGQGIRWVLNRRVRNKAEANIKLSELASKIATAHGVKLDYKAVVDPLYYYIDQSGISDYALLKRECEKNGLFISELVKGGTLTIKSLRDIRDTSLVMEPLVNLLSYTIKDVALDSSSDDAGSSLLQGEDKYRINPVTGQFEAIKPDVDPAKTQQDVTGKPKPTNAGTLSPGGDAIAQQARGRVKRVKGLPSVFTVVLDELSLAVEPLTAVRTKGLPGVLSRVWMVDSVTHEPSRGTSTINCYSPIEVVDASPQSPTSSGSNGSTTNPNLSTGDKNQLIYNAAIALKGMDTSKAPNTNGGRLACCWAVNRVLEKAGIGNPWSNSDAVMAAQKALNNTQYGMRIPAAQAQPGDIAIWSNVSDGSAPGHHIGIVMAAGGASILSNSSSKAKFVWQDSARNYEGEYGVKTQYYRMK